MVEDTGGGREGVGIEELLVGSDLLISMEEVEVEVDVFSVVPVEVEIMVAGVKVFVGIINSVGVDDSLVDGSSDTLAVGSEVEGRYSMELIS